MEQAFSITDKQALLDHINTSRAKSGFPVWDMPRLETAISSLPRKSKYNCLNIFPEDKNDPSIGIIIQWTDTN